MFGLASGSCCGWRPSKVGWGVAIKSGELLPLWRARARTPPRRRRIDDMSFLPRALRRSWGAQLCFSETTLTSESFRNRQLIKGPLKRRREQQKKKKKTSSYPSQTPPFTSLEASRDAGARSVPAWDVDRGLHDRIRWSEPGGQRPASAQKSQGRGFFNTFQVVGAVERRGSRSHPREKKPTHRRHDALPLLPGLLGGEHSNLDIRSPGAERRQDCALSAPRGRDDHPLRPAVPLFFPPRRLPPRRSRALAYLRLPPPFLRGLTCCVMVMLPCMRRRPPMDADEDDRADDRTGLTKQQQPSACEVTDQQPPNKTNTPSLSLSLPPPLPRGQKHTQGAG